MPILFKAASAQPYGCFSNFFAAPVEIDGKTWPTTEHYFQAMKHRRQPEVQARVRRAPSPKEAKRLANEVHGHLVDWAWWRSARDEVMLRAVRAKFEQHPELRGVLLGSGAEEIREHTRRDTYWGDGGDGRGKNRLGKILMQVRAELREAERQAKEGRS